jgi:hypothetical protein
LAVAGWLILIVAAVTLVIHSGRRMSDAEAQAYSSSTQKQSVGVFRGNAVGWSANAEASFGAIKGALRTGDWLRQVAWWPIVLTLFGVPLAACGMIGYFIVIGPPAVKLIAGAALAYANARLLWAWIRA